MVPLKGLKFSSRQIVYQEPVTKIRNNLLYLMMIENQKSLTVIIWDFICRKGSPESSGEPKAILFHYRNGNKDS